MWTLIFITTVVTLSAAMLVMIWPPYRPVEMSFRLFNASALSGVLIPFFKGSERGPERSTMFLTIVVFLLLSALFCAVLWRIRLNAPHTVGLVVTASSSVGLTFFLIQYQLLRWLP